MTPPKTPATIPTARLIAGDHLTGALSAFAFLASPLRDSVMATQLQNGSSPQEAFMAALLASGVSYMIGLNASGLIRVWRHNRANKP